MVEYCSIVCPRARCAHVRLMPTHHVTLEPTHHVTLTPTHPVRSTARPHDPPVEPARERVEALAQRHEAAAAASEEASEERAYEVASVVISP